MARIFVTGGSGFIGRHVLERLRRRGEGEVVCLSRNPERLAEVLAPVAGWRYLRGDLLEASSYESALTTETRVLHLAAATGNAQRREHEATNVEGTHALASAAARSDVAAFVLVSSIAVRFTDRRGYPYADTKEAAERLTRAAGVPFTIVRPTMVLGRGSPVLAGLRSLATGPVAVVPGSGSVQVQPVDVRDLADTLIEILSGPQRGDTIEVGGPERLSMEALMRRIRLAARGTEGPMLHVPLAPIRGALLAAERLLGPLLPASAGQFASFANHGIATLGTTPVPAGRSLATQLEYAISGG